MSFIIEMFKTRELRKKILFVFMILFLYKVGTHIPVPGVNASVLKQMLSGSGIAGLMNTFSGGALKNFSVFAIGIMPYITASIIIQLLSHDIVPKLTEWSKQGEMGKRKTKRLTYIISVIVAFVQSLGISFGFNKLYPGLISNPSTSSYVLIASILTLGSIVLMIFGELIDKKGIGRGSSLIISSGIIMGLPSGMAMYYTSLFANKPDMLFINIVKTLILVIIFLAVLVGIVMVHKATRRVPVQYPNQYMGSQRSFLPIKINSANVLPVIFAVAIFMMPVTIAQFFPNNEVAIWITGHVNYTHPIGMLVYAIIIILFTYFYAFIQTSPEQMADNLKKSGGSIPGIRPGKETQKYITAVLLRLTTVGAILLAFLTVLPLIIGQVASLPQQIQIGGTSIIIFVGVILDTVGQIKTYIVDRSYRSIIK